MDMFYPITKEFKTNTTNTTTTNSQKWTLIKELTQDSTDTSEIYEVKDNNDIVYILKHMPFIIYGHTHEDEQHLKKLEKAVLKEIQVHTKCFLLGIAPEIIDAWLCNKGAVIIMKKLTTTVCNILGQYKSSSIKILVLKEVFELISKMHENGICHGDTHLSNFMVNTTVTNITLTKNMTEIEKFKHMKYTIYVIDFGSTDSIRENEKQDYIICSMFLVHHLSKRKSRQLVEQLNVLTKEEIDRIFE